MNPTTRSRLWTWIQALMIVIFLHHALQPIAAWTGWMPWKAKHWVALGGGFLYGTCLVLLLRRQRLGLIIAVVGPLIGTTVLSTGALLMWLDLIQVEFRQDLVTVLGGIPQLIALGIAVLLLRKGRA